MQGKSGWLYRKNEDSKIEKDQFIQLWAVLYENKLFYYSEKPAGGDDPPVPKGSLIINRGGHCDIADEHNVKTVSLSGQGKNCFMVTEPALNSSQVSIIFSSTSESEKLDWMEKLMDAFGGVCHEMPADGGGSPSKSSQKKEVAVKKEEVDRSNTQLT